MQEMSYISAQGLTASDIRIGICAMQKSLNFKFSPTNEYYNKKIT